MAIEVHPGGTSVPAGPLKAVADAAVIDTMSESMENEVSEHSIAYYKEFMKKKEYQKQSALEALERIQKAFRRSSLSEEELQEAGKKLRRDIARERYRAGN